MSAPVLAATSAPSRRLTSLAGASAAGLIFGLGLALSGMTQPAKVIGFLNLGGAWDPSLAFVMGGAVAAYALMFRLVRRQRRAPLFDQVFHLPTRSDLDLGLVGGAAIFGIGWGLGGYCPGPGLVAAFAGNAGGLLFVGAMLVGMLAQHHFARR